MSAEDRDGMSSKQKKARRKAVHQAMNDLKERIAVLRERQRILQEKGLSETDDMIREDVRALDAVIRTLLENQELEAEMEPPALAAKTAAFAAFGAWLEKEAPNSLYGDTFAFDPNVAEGSGVIALKDVKKDQAVMQIPRRVMLASDHPRLAQAPLAAAFASDPMLAANPSLALAVQLMHERNDPKSFWRPYLDVLPLHFDLPLCFSFEELKELDGSPAAVDAFKLIRSTAVQYFHLTRVAPLAKHGFNIGARRGKALQENAASGAGGGGDDLPFTFAQFRWAVATVMSRQNRVPALGGRGALGGGHAIALIPAFDLLNHRPSESGISTFYDPRTDASVTFATREVRRHEPVYTHYGDRPNAYLLTYQGFVAGSEAHPHPHDWMRFTIKLKQVLPAAAAAPAAGAGAGASSSSESSSSSSSSSAAAAAAAPVDPLAALKAKLIAKQLPNVQLESHGAHADVTLVTRLPLFSAPGLLQPASASAPASGAGESKGAGAGAGEGEGKGSESTPSAAALAQQHQLQLQAASAGTFLSIAAMDKQALNAALLKKPGAPLASLASAAAAVEQADAAAPAAAAQLLSAEAALALQRRLEALLGAYPTSLEQDRKLLKKLNLDLQAAQQHRKDKEKEKEKEKAADAGAGAGAGAATGASSAASTAAASTVPEGKAAESSEGSTSGATAAAAAAAAAAGSAAPSARLLLALKLRISEKKMIQREIEHLRAVIKQLHQQQQQK